MQCIELDMKQQLAFILLIILMHPYLLFAAENNVVIFVFQNQKKYAELNSSEQLYARSVLQTFAGKLTLMREITLHTDANDRSLRQIQKNLQIETSSRFDSGNSAYRSDLASKADLRIEFSLAKHQDDLRFEYSTSEIESIDIVSKNHSEKYFTLDTIDKEIDRISYIALNALHDKGYIGAVSYNIQNQLPHKVDSAEYYHTYITAGNDSDIQSPTNRY